jgi:hypothetical protein
MKPLKSLRTTDSDNPGWLRRLVRCHGVVNHKSIPVWFGEILDTASRTVTCLLHKTLDKIIYPANAILALWEAVNNVSRLFGIAQSNLVDSKNPVSRVGNVLYEFDVRPGRAIIFGEIAKQSFMRDYRQSFRVGFCEKRIWIFHTFEHKTKGMALTPNEKS